MHICLVAVRDSLDSCIYSSTTNARDTSMGETLMGTPTPGASALTPFPLPTFTHSLVPTSTQFCSKETRRQPRQRPPRARDPRQQLHQRQRQQLGLFIDYPSPCHQITLALSKIVLARSTSPPLPDCQYIPSEHNVPPPLQGQHPRDCHTTMAAATDPTAAATRPPTFQSSACRYAPGPGSHRWVRDALR